MAIVNNGCKVSLAANQLPAGYVKPNVNTFTDYEYHRTLVLSVLKATVHNADPAVTLANILAEAAIGINKQVTDILAADFLGAANVTAYADLVRLENNFQSMLKDSPALTNANPSYLATINLYIKAL